MAERGFFGQFLVDIEALLPGAGAATLSFLKVGVDGREQAMLARAAALLEDQAVDAIYFETPVRAVTDVQRQAFELDLSAKGYRLLKRYGQGSREHGGAEVYVSPRVARLLPLAAFQNTVGGELSASASAPTEQDELQRQVAELMAKRDDAEHMAREVYRLFDDMRARERRARAEAALALERLERTRSHLSYRLGAALVQASRSLWGWLALPWALLRAYTDFRRSSHNGSPELLLAAQDRLRPGNNALSVPIKSDWERVTVECSGAPGELWVHSLSVTSGAVAAVELVVDRIGGEPRVTGINGTDFDGQGGDYFPVVRNVKLRAGQPVALIGFDSAVGELALRLRKTRGEPCIVRFELRGGGSSRLATIRDKKPAQLRAWAPAKMAIGRIKAPGTSLPSALFRAHKLLQEGRAEEAVALAEADATNEERPAVSLLRATLVGADDEQWLRHVNEYVVRLGLSPIQLKPGAEPRFQRLHSVNERVVEDGPLVSVIMPAFNAARTLELSTRSILNQTWRRLELIVVDDQSSDDTWQIAQRLAATDARVRLLRNAANVGPYVSKNIALRVAQGEYVTGHDADDWAHPERIQAHVTLAMAGKVRASLAGMLRMHGDGRFTRFAPQGPNTTDGALVAGFISALFEARFLKERLGGWDEVRFGGDSELIKRAELALGRSLPRYGYLSMICLDSPDGLTNHPEFGHSPTLGVSPTRKAYRASFEAWHASLDASDTYLPFPQVRRRFDVPQGAAVDAHALAATLRSHTCSADNPSGMIRGSDVCDVCIVTDLRFPGGNASSTLEEVRCFQALGLRVLLVHCPSARSQGKPISGRFEAFRSICEHSYNVSSIETDVLIVRHPTVVVCPRFEALIPRIRAKASAVIVNNALRRSDGERVYSLDVLSKNVAALGSPSKSIYPLGPAIRKEIEAIGEGSLLAREDWTPTFDSKEFEFRPKSTMTAPFVIGRHARDGVEKWIEDREKLSGAYPEDRDFAVRILGGADAAVTVLGALPANWEVLPFGSLPPAEYLASLDALVYFPHSGLTEAFGRTLMEAIFSGVPCVVPPLFEATFEDMAFYCQPHEVSSVVRRLSTYPDWRLHFLAQARQRARVYDSRVLHQRLLALRGEASSSVAPQPSPFDVSSAAGLTPGVFGSTLSAYKAWVESGRRRTKLADQPPGSFASSSQTRS
jgi:glycosyltransferase involved in cell wall biosynthesis